MIELKEDLIEPRAYQRTIAEVAARKNTLVVLPTGMGKTLIAVLVGVSRLQKYPGSKIMITSPTRPLNAQHKRSFERFTSIPANDIVLITGKIQPDEREQLYEEATVVAATPQCISNDLLARRLNLAKFSFITFDEAHRAVSNYAYTRIAKKNMLQSEHPLILGLTASPGATYSKIKEICDNLFIKAVEIRSEKDADMKPYVKPIEREWVYVELPEQFQRVKTLLESKLQESLQWLRQRHYLHTSRPTKKMLLALQKKVGKRYSNGSKSYANIWAMIRSAEAIKLEHAIELLETQGIPFLHDYLQKMQASKKRTDAGLMKDNRIKEALAIVEQLHSKGIEHPKLAKLRYIIKDLIAPEVKIIVFANYRATVERVRNILAAEGIAAEAFIGQATKEGKGLKQEEQIKILKSFRAGAFNVLVATSVGEEGIDIPSVDYAVFYEPVPSAIRTIQRRGRVGRQTAGKVIFLITKGTRDEAYYWAALHKERKMKGILYDLQKGKKLEKRKTLLDWTKK